MTRNCIICQTPFESECIRKETCRDKTCRKKRKSQLSHKSEREKPWVKCRSRLQDRHKAILKRAGVKVDKVGLYLKASTRRIKIHIKNQFNGRWTWDDYGFEQKDEHGNITKRGFVIDHIVPCNIFDVSKKEHLAVLWSLQNLRPMDHIENLQKLDDIHLDSIPPYLLAKVEALGIILDVKNK